MEIAELKDALVSSGFSPVDEESIPHKIECNNCHSSYTYSSLKPIVDDVYTDSRGVSVALCHFACKFCGDFLSVGGDE